VLFQPPISIAASRKSFVDGSTGRIESMLSVKVIPTSPVPKYKSPNLAPILPTVCAVFAEYCNVAV
jgi:hypothetical protein